MPLYMESNNTERLDSETKE